MIATSCAATRSDRIMRAVAAVFLGAFALTGLDNTWCAIPAAVCATFLMIGAITGWCPTDIFRNRGSSSAPNAFGFPEAKNSLSQTSRNKKTSIDA